ncbi:MAG TPA: MaoC family dehydratase [Rhizomicrobium sp.]|jgi:acyl dehydratase
MNPQYWEDIEIGARRELGTYTFSEDEIIAFARQYDPQIFHIDPQAAKQTVFGGLIASGWHTVAVWMKLAIAGRAQEKQEDRGVLRAGVSPGFEALRWLKPVRPGMTLAYSSEVTAKVESRSRPEWGLVMSRNEARDESGALVMVFTGKGFVQRRPSNK